MLTVVIPAYNEEGNVQNTANTVGSILAKADIDYEIIFVDDGSKDKTWETLTQVCESDKRVSAISFSRNFGKEAAIFAGLKEARGDACVIMDCDLQHPPEVIVQMYNIWKNNDVDVVEGIKSSRGKENSLYKAFSLMFYKMIKSSSGLEMAGASDFKLMGRAVVDALNDMPERLTFFRAMSSWVGFRTEKVYFDVAPRAVGERKWSTKGLVKYAINSITSFSSFPMQAVTFFGAVLFIISLIMGVHTLYNKIAGNSLEGFSTVILLQLFTSSIIMFSLGIIGYYLAKIYEEIKNRPRYIIGKKIISQNISDNNDGREISDAENKEQSN